MSDKIASKNIYQRILEVQKKVTTVFKNETVKMHKDDKGYKAVSHDDVASALHIPLAENGIVLIPDVIDFSTTTFEKRSQKGFDQTWYRTDIKIKVKWINADNPSDFIESTGAAFALDTSDKSFAKAYSLALKIVLLKVHLLESRDDEEQRPFDKESVPEARPKPVLKKKDDLEKEKQAPSEIIIPFGKAKGKTIGSLDTETLILARDWMKSEMAKDPKPANLKQIQFIYSQVKAVLIDRGESLENPPVLDKTEKMPEDKSPDPADFIVTRDFEDLPVKGKKLSQIGEGVLKQMIKILDGEMKKTPPPSNVGDLFALRNQIVAFLKTVGAM